MDYKMLFSPMKIGNCEIKNRIVMAPMCLGFGQFNGDATEAMIKQAHLRSASLLRRATEIFRRLPALPKEYISMIQKFLLSFIIPAGKM